MTAPRPSWDDYGLGLARAAATRADCTRRKAGAVLMGADRRILALGYNGAPSGEPGCLSAGACPRGRFSHDEIPPGLGNSGHAIPCIAVHAEVNCLEHLKRDRPRWDWEQDLAGATLYITSEPCRECWRYIAEHLPLNRIVTPGGAREVWTVVA